MKLEKAVFVVRLLSSCVNQQVNECCMPLKYTIGQFNILS